MKLYNLIEQSILKGNFLNIGSNTIMDEKVILQNLMKLMVLLSLGSILVSKEYKKYALVCLSIFLPMYFLENFNVKKIKKDMNNPKGNNLIGKDDIVKEASKTEDFYDTIELHHNDLINKNIMDRNFYILPNAIRINDQKKYGKWLYYQKDGCKENTANCFKNEDLKNR